MMNRPSWLQRAMTWLVIVTLALAGCASPPPRAPVVQPPVAAADDYATITGVAIDGRAAAAPDADAARVWRGNAYLPARAGFELQPGDVLQTGARGELVVAYRNGSVLYMHHLSRGRVGSLLGVVGRVFVKVKGFFEVETTFVKAGARGTAFEVATAPDGSARVLVVDGAVEVASTRGLWRPVRIGAGSRGVAQMHSAPQPISASRSELQAVEQWVDRLERLPTRADGGGNRTRNTVVGAVAIAALLALLASREGGGRDGAAGGDRRDEPAGRTPDPTPPPPSPPALAAPTGLIPGSRTPQRPQVMPDCRNLRLRWDAVGGARDYAYVVEQRGNTGWQARVRDTSMSTSATVALGSGEHRWSVAARSGNTVGPSSAPLYLHCLPVVR
jgi:hypothetical protein